MSFLKTLLTYSFAVSGTGTTRKKQQNAIHNQKLRKFPEELLT